MTATARWIGKLTVGVLVLSGAAAARADAGATGECELSGTVIRSDGSTLYLEHMGAVVPVEILSDTRFSGVRSAHELAAGQAVRATFTVKGDTKNVAHAISLGASPATKARAPVGYQADQDYGG